jgi:hypothetical protein
MITKLTNLGQPHDCNKIQGFCGRVKSEDAQVCSIRFIKGRLKFGNSKNSAPFPSMVVIFRN